MRKITLEELIECHDIVLQAGGVPGIKNQSMLESAIENPFSTMYGIDLYPSDESKIAMTVYSLINNHGFEDANKRTSILVMQMLLEDCDILLDATEDDYIQLAINVTQTYDKYDIEQWINNHRI